MLFIINVRKDLPRLVRNRGKTVERLGPMLFQSILWTEMMSIWKKIIPHSIKRIQLLLQVCSKSRKDHELEAKSVFPVLRQVSPVTTQV